MDENRVRMLSLAACAIPSFVVCVWLPTCLAFESLEVWALLCMCVCVCVSVLSLLPTNTQTASHLPYRCCLIQRAAGRKTARVKTIKHRRFLKIKQERRLAHKSKGVPQNTFSIIPRLLDLRFSLLLIRNVWDQMGRVNSVTVALLWTVSVGW